MSTLEEPEVEPDGLDIDAVHERLGDRVLDTEEHINAPGIIIRADEVEETLTILRDEFDFDYLACVSAEELPDRYETIYHLKQFADPTRELSIVVPTDRDRPISQSAAHVYETANWHEREAYDLIGIEYDGHPNLKRILLPDSWTGHPLTDDYNQDKPQVVSYKAHENPLLEHTKEDDGETMLINIGPHHPATHGVLHLKATLDGESVVDVEPDIGYLQRCEEQMCEQGTYRHQIMPYPDRWDYASAGIINEWAYARAAEDLADIEVPEYAQILRTMGAELCRMAAHFLALGTFVLDVYGEFNALSMYAIRDREKVQKLLEDLTGQRIMFNYLRLGGVAWDIPEPREQFFDDTRQFINEDLPESMDEVHDLLTDNEIFQLRCVDIGVLPPKQAKQYAATGPVARASGIDMDLRRDDPYGYYPELDWEVVTDDGCDIFSRVMVRVREVEESAKIVDQCIDLLEEWPEDEREIQANVPRTLKPDPDTRVYRAVEGAKGELGIYIRADGTDTPGRFKIRSPAYCNLSTLPVMAEGDFVADLIASLGSIDIILGEVDR